MYLVLGDDKKIIVNTINELKQFDLDKTEIYGLTHIDYSELLDDGDIRDEITNILKGKQMTKNELIEEVIASLDIPKSKVSKVITKMKKENFIYNVNDFNYLGERFIGMD